MTGFDVTQQIEFGRKVATLIVKRPNGTRSLVCGTDFAFMNAVLVAAYGKGAAT